jgi:hypothetical protein
MRGFGRGTARRALSISHGVDEAIWLEARRLPPKNIGLV